MNLELHPDEVASLANYNHDERRISIFTDSDVAHYGLQSIAEHVGGRVIFCGSTRNALNWLSDCQPSDAMFVDVTNNEDTEFDIVLERLNAFGLIEGTPILVNCTPECLDRVWARMSAPSVALMCDANGPEWLVASSLLKFSGNSMLHDVGLNDGFRLQRLADDVQRIASTLADLVGNEPPPMRRASDALIGFSAEPTYFKSLPGAITASDVRAIIRLRRMRDRIFRSDLFADPAWDMLLDLMAARLERMPVAVSSLCIAAAVPPTTALRWIKTMSDNGMFVRVADPEDGRRVFIELSDGAAAGMNAYLSAAKAQGGLAV